MAISLVSCEEINAPDYQLEGKQWITEELASESGNHRLIYDIGCTEAGQLYTMKLYTEDSYRHKAGELHVDNKNPYTYDADSKVLTVCGFIKISITVNFLDGENVIMSLLGETQAFSSLNEYYDPVQIF